MKNILKIAILLISNASIGVAAIVAVIGLFVGSLYIVELAEKLFTQITSPTVQWTISIGISSIIALYLLVIFGSWVREKIEDIVWEVRSQRQNTN